MTKHHLFGLSSGLALAMACTLQAAPALAQDDGVTLEDVVVTAEKRTSTEQKTPIAMSVITPELLQKNGVASLRDLQAIAPSVSFTTSNAATIVSVRGVSSRDTTEIGDPAVTIAIDGFNLQRAIGLNASMFDLERVEVLRGPQGTLLGRNSTGGAINIITAKPVEGFAASIAGEVGNYQTFNTKGMINLPVNDWLTARAAFQTQDRNGYRDNAPAKDGDDDHSKAARLTLDFHPVSRLKILLTGEYTNLDQVGPVVQGIPVDVYTTATGPFLPGDIVLQRPVSRMNGDKFPLAPGHFTKSSTWNIRSTTTYDLDFAKITYVGGWRKFEFHRMSTLGGAYGTNRQNFAFNANEKLKSWNHELRLSSNDTGKLIWQVGAYYFKESNNVHTRFLDFPGSPGFYGNYIVLQDYIYPNISTKTRALFGQASYEILEGLRIEGGVRYSKDNKTRVGYNVVTGAPQYLASGCTQATCPFTTNIQNSRTADTKTTFHLALNYQVTPRHLVYAKFDTGYKAGGFTDLNTYGPETIKSYEIGSKSRFWDGRLQLNLAGYWYDYSDQQVNQFLNTPQGIVAQIVVNAGKSRYKGVEADLIAQVTPADRLNLYVGYSDAKYQDFLISAGAPTSQFGRMAISQGRYIPTSATTGNWQLKGNRPPNAPEWTISGGYQHDFLVFGGTLTPRVQARYESTAYYQFFNFDSDKQPGYVKADVLLSFKPDNGNWTLDGWVRNVGNKRTLAFAADPTSAVYRTYRYQYQAPRTYGVRLAFNW